MLPEEAPATNSVVELALEGHLSEAHLASVLAGALPRDAALVLLLVDCTGMTGYDLVARHAFVDWLRTERGRIAAVGVVTDKRLWHMVISAMAFASGQNMRPFSKIEDAARWLETAHR